MAQSPLDFTLDRDSDLPLGAQLGWRLRALIAAGRLAEGDRLPPVRELAALAGVNVNTVRAVYGRLADEGVIVSEHGRGTFVTDRSAAERELTRLNAAFTRAEHGGAAEPEPPRHGDAPSEAAREARRRASLRAEIALLERELAALEPATNGESAPKAGPPAPKTGARSRPEPQLLTAADLEATRDDLVARLQPLRAGRTEVRRRTESERHERAQAELVRKPGARQRAIATTTPKFETGSGGWSLRWRG